MSQILSGLREGWWMFFDTFWALVFGFTLSGAVQAFISRRQMQRALGDHSLASVARASFFGVVSSSCSYAASALARSLVSKGADFTASMIFMFASTNLVIELGLVLWVLIGWQFALAEFVGGSVMILLLWVLLPRFIPEIPSGLRQSDVHDQVSEMAELPLLDKVKSRRSWSDAAGYTIGDFTMLRIELVLGFVVAGLASTLVPLHVWRSLFLSGHGLWSAVENAVIGPFLAFISFVCSVGNVPLAAALWNAGITFGGVIAFIFADLVAFPLVMIYRKYYGNALALRLSLTFWLVMSLSGLVTEGIFSLFHLIPTKHALMMNQSHFGLNATTILNGVALLLVFTVFWLYRTKDRTGKSSEFAKDLVCGMQVRIADAPASAEYEGEMYYFCMQGCMEAFLDNPDKYLSLIK
jgi:uncharacterized membrane protein YraQ (UPF0718 family)/YHS domain-containing protein